MKPDANKGDGLTSVWLASILGTVVEKKQMSTKDKLLRKKDMGICKWESMFMGWRMSKFPRTMARYILRKRMKRDCCCWGCLGEPQEEELRDTRLVCRSPRARGLGPEEDKAGKIQNPGKLWIRWGSEDCKEKGHVT